VTGRDLKLTMFGKPFPVTYRYAEEVLERQVKDDALLVSSPRRVTVPCRIPSLPFSLAHMRTTGVDVQQQSARAP
jgi:hypothetical protein